MFHLIAIATKCRHGFFCLAAVTIFLWGGMALGQDSPNLDSLRLGSRYLSWAPATGAAAPAAPAASPGTTPAPTPPMPPAPSNQQTPEPAPVPGMSLAEWESLAEQNNPTLVQAGARVQAARAECLQAGLYPNPRVGYQATEINDEGQAGQQGGYIGQEVVTNGKLKRNRELAEQVVRQFECAWVSQRGRVVNDVRHAFYDVLVAQRSMELTEQLVRIGREGVRASEGLLKAKERSRVDVLQAKIEADSAQILAQKAHNRYDAAWRNLAIVAGVPNMAPAPLAGDLQEGLSQLTWDEAIGRVLNESPTAAEAQQGVARAQAALARECAQQAPNVDLQAGVQYDNATRDAIAGVQVGVPIPLFNRNQGNIRRAEADLVSARAEVRRVEFDLRQRLAGAFEQYQNARCQVEKFAGDILPNAQTSLDLTAAGYRQGEFDYITLLTAQRTFFQVNLAYIEALRDLRAATIAIQGNMLGDSLQQR
jgi:outer membrane protein, heavy metal efflux system